MNSHQEQFQLAGHVSMRGTPWDTIHYTTLYTVVTAHVTWESDTIVSTKEG